MPTWRKELRDVDENVFVSSDYFKSWHSLINHQNFIKILEKNNYICIFYLHFSLQKFAYLFKQTNNFVFIATFDKYDVQQLLKESSLLITDYSSVFFDFAYMRKPVIYYQFDFNDFYSKHYKTGFFNHIQNGFGPVCTSEEETIKSLEQQINKNCSLGDAYLQRINDFFELYDTKNCERIFNAIIKRKNNELQDL